MDSSINSRILLVRKKLGLTRQSFGESLGVTDSVVKNIDYNKTAPKSVFIDLLCKTYNVNKDWLLTGEGEMFNELTKDEQIAEFVGTVLAEEEDSFKRRFFTMLSNLSDDGWAFLEQMVEGFAAEKAADNKEDGDV